MITVLPNNRMRACRPGTDAASCPAVAPYVDRLSLFPIARIAIALAAHVRPSADVAHRGFPVMYLPAPGACLVPAAFHHFLEPLEIPFNFLGDEGWSIMNACPLAFLARRTVTWLNANDVYKPCTASYIPV